MSYMRTVAGRKVSLSKQSMMWWPGGHANENTYKCKALAYQRQGLLVIMNEYDVHEKSTIVHNNAH